MDDQRKRATSLAELAAEALHAVQGVGQDTPGIASALQRCAELERDARALRRRCGRELRVSFLGLFSSGKSSLINSIIKELGVEGRDFESVRREEALAPTDDLITLVQHERAWRDAGEPDLEYATHSIDALKDVVLIDTPGWGNDPDEDRIGRRCVAEADVVVHVINSSHAMPRSVRTIFDSDLAAFEGLPIVYVFAHAGAYLFHGDRFDERAARDLVGTVRAEVRAGFGDDLEDTGMLPSYGRNVFFLDNRTGFGVEEFTDFLFEEYAARSARTRKRELLLDQITTVGRSLVEVIRDVKGRVERADAEGAERVDAAVTRTLADVQGAMDAALARWEAECSAQLATRLAGPTGGADELSRRAAELDSDEVARLGDHGKIDRNVVAFSAPLERATGIRERLAESEEGAGSFVLDAGRMVDGLRESWARLETAACRELAGEKAPDRDETPRALLNNISSSCQDAFRSKGRDRLEAELKALAETSATETRVLGLGRALTRALETPVERAGALLAGVESAVASADRELRSGYASLVEGSTPSFESTLSGMQQSVGAALAARAGDFDLARPGSAEVVVQTGAAWSESLYSTLLGAWMDSIQRSRKSLTDAAPPLSTLSERCVAARAALDGASERARADLEEAIEPSTVEARAAIGDVRTALGALTPPSTLVRAELMPVTDRATDRAREIIAEAAHESAGSRWRRALASIASQIPMATVIVALTATLYYATDISGRNLAALTAVAMLGLTLYALLVAVPRARARAGQRRAFDLADALKEVAEDHLREAREAVNRINTTAREELGAAAAGLEALGRTDALATRVRAIQGAFAETAERELRSVASAVDEWTRSQRPALLGVASDIPRQAVETTAAAKREALGALGRALQETLQPGADAGAPPPDDDLDATEAALVEAFGEPEARRGARISAAARS